MIIVNSLAEVKKHLNIEQSFDEDDNYITALIDVAEERVLSHCDKAADDIDVVPPSMKHAVLLLVAEMYAHRELSTDRAVNALPISLDYLLANVKNYSF